MSVLLDTHTLIWVMDATDRLSPRAYDTVTDPDSKLTISAGTLWEIGIKVGIGKLRVSLPFREWMSRAIDDLELDVLPITLDVTVAQSELVLHHRDPFDRLLIATAITRSSPIVSVDAKLDPYGITRIW